MFAFDAQYGALDLEGQLVGLSVGSSAAIVQAVQAAVFVAVKDLVTGDAGNAELPAHGSHLLTLEQAGNKSESFIHWFTLIPRHLGSPQMRQCVNHVSGIICKLSVRKHNVFHQSDIYPYHLLWLMPLTSVLAIAVDTMILLGQIPGRRRRSIHGIVVWLVTSLVVMPILVFI